VKALAARIGLYRIAAILIGCALLLEILRVEVLSETRTGTIVSTMGEVLLLALAAGVFMLARSRSARR
jgi:hypothetical protein